MTSLPFRPVREPPRPESTLVSNTGQSPSAQATITSAPYRMEFKLGSHGQGYEISGVSIDLAAAPSSLTVSLWMGRAPGSGAAGAQTKLFDFENPPSFKAGLNRFTAPAGAFTYQNVAYFIVLSDFGDSLSIMRTTSEAEDAGGEPGATLADSVDEGSSVLRLAVKGWRRDRGILVSTYGQEQELRTLQEIISLSDEIGFKFTVGAADRYLIRGATFAGDNASTGGGFTSPWLIRDGTDELFPLISTRQISGINEFTASQGATVAGGCTTVMSVETCEEYNFYQEIPDPRVGGVTLMRVFGTTSTNEDEPKATGVTIVSGGTDDLIIGTVMDPGKLLMAIFGEPLVAMVQNLGQTDGAHQTLGSNLNKVASQGFTTGSDGFGYRLQGIGVNIEGAGGKVPDGPTSVSVAVYTADSDGKPEAKLFDLLSPTEFAPGHSFFEAPPGTHLTPNTSYVMVWRHLDGTSHRLRRTASSSEDSGARSGSSIADEFYTGVFQAHLVKGSDALEIAVYTAINTRAPFVAGGIPVPLSWFHIPDGAYAGYQFRALFVTHHAINATSADVADYHAHVQFEASGQSKRYPEKAGRYTDPVIRRVAEQFKSVVCTATAKNARKNTDMTGIGVPIHWLDGGSQHRDTLVANHYAGFYGPTWETTEYGAHVTGNSTPLFEISSDEATRSDKIADGIWTGCDSTGMAHSDYHLGSTMGMATLGTPADESTSNAPIGPSDSSTGMIAILTGEHRSIYGISPIFTVYDDGSPRTIFSASMTVGTTRTSVAPVTIDRAGVGANHGRLLGSTQFTYEGTSYSITTLRTRKVTNSGSVTADEFNLQLSTLFPIAADSKLALELDDGGRRRRFLLSEATRQQTDHYYSWSDHGGLSWTDGNFVEIKLIELPD